MKVRGWGARTVGAFVAKLLLRVRGHAGLQALGSWGGADGGGNGDGGSSARALAYASAAAAAMQREAVDGEALLDWLGGSGDDCDWAADDVALGELAAFGEWAEDVGVLAGVVRLWVAEEVALSEEKAAGAAKRGKDEGVGTGVVFATETEVMLLLPSRAARAAFEKTSGADGGSWGWGWGWDWDVEDGEEEAAAVVATAEAARSPVARQAAEAAAVGDVLKWREVDAGYWLSQAGLAPAVPAFAAQVRRPLAFFMCLSLWLRCTCSCFTAR